MSCGILIASEKLNPFGQAYFSLEEEELVSLIQKEFPILGKTSLKKRTYFRDKRHPSNLIQRVKDICVEFNPELFPIEIFIHNDDVRLYIEKKSLAFQKEQEKKTD